MSNLSKSDVTDSVIKWLKNLKHLIGAIVATLVYRYPAKNLKIIGVTGTDGKTTTVHLIYSILKLAGERTAFVSSIEARIRDKEIDTGFHVTTPNPWLLQRLLRQMVDEEVEYLVLEATSHGLDQHRLFGCNFQVGVITNITHEHLDYHKTFKKYLAAKAKLFHGVKIAVLNRDERHFNYLKRAGGRTRIVSYGINKEADYTLKKFKFKTKLSGKYNLYNCLAAIATAKALGIKDEIIRKAVADFSGLPGRLEKIDKGQDFSVFVDFAHTPNGLENVLQALRKEKKGRLIVVFGCAGERDKTKRPIMGEIASRLADLVVLTAEDPRTEDVDKIIDQIAAGCQKAGWIEGEKYFRVPDRREAIKFALKKLAKKGDIIVICGKGHEKSMCFGNTEYPWSDQKEVRLALK